MLELGLGDGSAGGIGAFVGVAVALVDLDERLQLFEWVRENSAEGKILIAGTASEGVHETVALVNRAAEMGYHSGFQHCQSYEPSGALVMP